MSLPQPAFDATPSPDPEAHDQPESPPTPANALPLLATVAIAILALAPRLLYLFFGGDPQNAGDSQTDTYHHWQIGYLTWTVGLSHDFRLWDLKGLEYFWGVVHPVLLVLLFSITRSVDIVVPRLVSIAFGTLNVVLLSQLCARYWNRHVVAAVAIFAALAPPVVFADSLGMVEPLAIGFILAGLWFLPRRGFLAGLVWALAAMARAEAWLFTAALLVASAIRRISAERRLALLIGWLLGIGLYMNLLLIRTGNPIYPVYWEFLVEGTGRWLAPATTSQGHMAPIFASIAFAAFVGIGLTVWQRPASYLLLCYGFGSTAFVMGLLAFTPFISSWSGWVWRMRLFSFSLEFAAMLLAVALFMLAPRYLGKRALIGAWVIMLGIVAGAQSTWIPIRAADTQTESVWQQDLADGKTIARLYEQPINHWGRLNIPADQPSLTYSLVRFGGVQGPELVGQLYDAFYNLPAGYRYADHPAEAGRLMACWLSSTKTSVLVLPASNQNYRQFLNDHSSLFIEIASLPDRGWLVEAVASPNAMASLCK